MAIKKQILAMQPREISDRFLGDFVRLSVRLAGASK